jgi:hypothetical protein
VLLYESAKNGRSLNCVRKGHWLCVIKVLILLSRQCIATHLSQARHIFFIKDDTISYKRFRSIWVHKLLIYFAFSVRLHSCLSIWDHKWLQLLVRHLKFDVYGSMESRCAIIFAMWMRLLCLDCHLSTLLHYDIVRARNARRIV